MKEKNPKEQHPLVCQIVGCGASVDPTDKLLWMYWSTIVRDAWLYHLCPEHDPTNNDLSLYQTGEQLEEEKKRKEMKPKKLHL